MNIKGMGVTFPVRSLANNDVVAMVDEHSRNLEEKTLQMINTILKRTGANSRRWCGEGETSLSLTTSACQKAIDDAGGSKGIDLLISASVHTEMYEPSSSSVIAHALGLDSVECFDIKQACDGWSKAVQIASTLIESGGYRRILVVNGEYPMTQGFGIFPELFNLQDASQLEYRFPGYTLGEAASAMVLASGPGNVWSFHNNTRNDLYDLCTITMPWHDQQPLPSQKIARDGAGVFTSYGGEMFKHALPIVVRLFSETNIDPEEVDILFTHSSSKRDWAIGAKEMGLSSKIYDIYEEFGNVVSAAIPTAMAVAKDRGHLNRGDRVLALVASAGMSFTASSFIY